MTFGAALLLVVAISAPVKATAPPAPARGAPAPARTAPAPAAAGVCTKYGVFAEKNELAGEDEVAAWATAALEGASLFDKGSPCFLHVRITASPIRSGGRQDGWMAHVGVSTRRFLRNGKLVTREKGMLFVEPLREGLVAKARSFVEEYVAKMRPEAGGSVLGSDRG